MVVCARSCVHAKKRKFRCVALLVPTQVWEDNIIPLQHLPMMLLACLFAFAASLLHSFVCVCRYTSAPTLEINRMSVTILAVGGSLQQVAGENSVICHRAVSLTLQPFRIFF